jgi:hypothetical protein
MCWCVKFKNIDVIEFESTIVVIRDWCKERGKGRNWSTGTIWQIRNYYFYWCYWDLNSGPCGYQAGTLSLEPYFQPFFTLVIFQVGSPVGICLGLAFDHSSCLQLLGTEITGPHYHAWLIDWDSGLANFLPLWTGPKLQSSWSLPPK